MSNDEFREPQQAARQIGLERRQEQKLARATYTAAEVKVLTEAALRLGRKEAGEEIAHILATERDKFLRGYPGWRYLNIALAKALEVASRPPYDATSARTDPSVDSDLPPEPQAVRSPQEDA